MGNSTDGTGRNSTDARGPIHSHGLQRELTPESKELQPESVESRAQLEGFVEDALSLKRRAKGEYVTPVVYVVDNDRVFQEVTAKQLAGAGFIVRCYRSGEEFLKARCDDRAGCILLDYTLPGMNGLELQKVITSQPKAMPIIFVSAGTDVHVSISAMKAGAMDFLVKPVEEEALVRAVRNAVGYFESTRSEREHLQGLKGRYEKLTSREMQVMAHVVAGRKNNVIAMDLNISIRTVKVHRGSVMRKMGVVSLADLVRAAKEIQVGDGG